MPRTVRKAVHEWEQVFTGTMPKGVGDAGSGEASVAARLAGPNLRQHVWLLRNSPDGDILARFIKVLHQRVSMGLFTMFIKIRAHRGEILNEKADRWADEGREDIDNVQ